MTIILNGEKKDVPDGITVFSLLEHLNIHHQRVAVDGTKRSRRQGRRAGSREFHGGGASVWNTGAECGITAQRETDRRRRSMEKNLF
jgi:hypothetical protein